MSVDPSASAFCTMDMDGMTMRAHSHHRRQLGWDHHPGRSSASNSGVPVPTVVHGDSTNFVDGDDAYLGNHPRHRALPSSSSMGTIMYMDGFRWALFPPPDSPPPPCLNLFYPSWTLHTQARFVLAMTSVTFIGMLVEACGVWRARCLRKGRARRAAERVFVDVAPGSSSSSSTTSSRRARAPSRARRWHLLAALLHASRVWLGYLLMLAVMSYAVEFLLSAVLGVVLGRYCLNDADGGGVVGVAGGVIGGMGHGDDGGGVDAMVAQYGNDDETWGGGGDPCCDHDDDMDVREPLLSSSIALGNGGVTRRSVA
ncbi:hypothetical protein ACHAXA_009997 [Cyclostephanos tholiformis]|uniref:Copper transport protein n=1 Tax=Cyclostephanos tholiformis TaxID=382380 RepID=A0ABD3RCJ4_9STRA